MALQLTVAIYVTNFAAIKVNLFYQQTKASVPSWPAPPLPLGQTHKTDARSIPMANCQFSSVPSTTFIPIPMATVVRMRLERLPVIRNDLSVLLSRFRIQKYSLSLIQDLKKLQLSGDKIISRPPPPPHTHTHKLEICSIEITGIDIKAQFFWNCEFVFLDQFYT